ncbi:helix-turn-helix domain-containing protein [Nocardiopsis sp. NPDC058631]|uniref:helix-turn-helix domain-containing protein n=1 Tax=Nocardiopsis sp. NPDC058631 TaxID=3346566 RepID=UPI00365329C5
MQDPRSPSLRLRRLATELRRSRESANYTAARVAKELGWSSPKVTRMETTDSKRIKPDDLDKLMDLYRITDATKRESMHALAKDARLRGWWSRYKDVFRNESLPDFEAEASVLRNYQSQLIPGLLQVPEYTADIFRGARYTDPDEIERHVEARMARREILVRINPVHLRAVIDEAALLRPIGGLNGMLAQMKHLLHMAQLPNIDIQILPLDEGTHAGFTASFVILDFPSPLDTPIICIETLADALYLEEHDDVEMYVATFGDIQGSAASTLESVDIIHKHIKRLENHL